MKPEDFCPASQIKRAAELYNELPEDFKLDFDLYVNQIYINIGEDNIETLMKHLTHDEVIAVFKGYVMLPLIGQQEVQELSRLDACVGCGWCCTTCDPIGIEKGTAKQLIKKTGQTFKELTKKVAGQYTLRNTKPCQFHDGKCTVYDQRPLACRAYPIAIQGDNIIVAPNHQCIYSVKMTCMRIQNVVNSMVRQYKRRLEENDNRLEKKE